MRAEVDDIRILNGLIAATMDSARHYRKVAGTIGDPRLRALFERLSMQRKMIAQGLQIQLSAFSNHPLADALPAIPAARVFGDLRRALDYGYCALIDEVERGEEHVQAKYECALMDGKLSGLSLMAVQSAFESVREGSAKMHALKCYPSYPAIEQGHGERLEQR